MSETQGAKKEVGNNMVFDGTMLVSSYLRETLNIEYVPLAIYLPTNPNDVRSLLKDRVEKILWLVRELVTHDQALVEDEEEKD